jgi:hypothetical protein
MIAPQVKKRGLNTLRLESNVNPAAETLYLKIQGLQDVKKSGDQDICEVIYRRCHVSIGTASQGQSGSAG